MPHRPLLPLILFLPLLLPTSWSSPLNGPNPDPPLQSIYTPIRTGTLLNRTTTPHIHKRTPSHDSLVHAGTANRLALEAPPDQIAQSQWDAADYDRLADFGWARDGGGQHSAAAALEGLDFARLAREWPRGIRLAGETGDLAYSRWVHGRVSTEVGEGGQRYNPTRANYPSVVDARNGVFLAPFGGIWAPRRGIQMFRSQWRGGEIAPLSQWSDVVFLEWMRQSQRANGRAEINYILFHKIAREDDDPTGGDIIDAIFDVLARTASGNPGPPVISHWRTFSFAEPRDAAAFLALLGTEAGNMVSKLLSEHKADLGVRRVTSISVFARGSPQERFDRQRVQPSMVFKVEAPGLGSGLTTGLNTPGLTSGSGSPGESDEESEGSSKPQRYVPYQLPAPNPWGRRKLR